jgi:hypothetical protein
MNKTTFTSGAFSFVAFDEEGNLYSSQRMKEFYVLKVSAIPATGIKTVRLNHPQIGSDLIFTQLRINKTTTPNLNLQIDIYRGEDFIDRMAFTDADLPYQFKNGCVIDPHGHQSNLFNPIELRISSNKVIDSLYFICERCFIYPVTELLETY